MVDVSVIIVNYNTRDLLRDCLESVVNTVKTVTYEVIVVDNASVDGSVAMVKEEYPWVKLITNEKNRGFAAANNQAFAIMEGRYALLLNTDAVLTEGAVHELYSFMEKTPETGMCCGQLLNADGSKQSSIAVFPTIVTLLFNMSVLEFLFPSRFPGKRYEHLSPLEIESGVGACLMIRKEALDHVGWFDERYFFFFEETDLARKMHMMGWKVFFVPTARIYHYQGKSIGVEINSRIHFYRSRYQYFKKWYNPIYFSLVKCVIFIRLAVNFLGHALAAAFMLGRGEEVVRKLKLYKALILLHIKEPSSFGI
ncbi:MAG: glycosyltransferase family 2 protein [Syntrophales bacterium]|nr:glycosyltransferase family 2 protein [Syntrophales bacterium]